MDKLLAELHNIIPQPADDIDPDLLLLAVVGRNSMISPEILNRLEQKYGTRNYESLEFLGDAILESLLRYIIYQQLAPRGPGVMTRVDGILRSNKVFACLANNFGLCQYVVTKSKVTTKICADVFESLTGAVFLHLIKTGRDAYAILYDWLVNFWKIGDYFNDIINNVDNSCIWEGPNLGFTGYSIPYQASPPKPRNWQTKISPPPTTVPQSGPPDPRLILQDFFIRVGISGPEYLITPVGVTITCPSSICGENKYLGTSNNPDLNSAEYEAATWAIYSLRQLGWQV